MVPRSTHYVPGVCNIGGAEIRARKVFGLAMAAVTVAVMAMLVALSFDPVWRFVVVVPATMAAVGFWQGYAGFCAAFGLRGAFNFGPKVGDAERVPAADDRRRDRQRAMTIVAGSTAIGVLVALVFYALPT